MLDQVLRKKSPCTWMVVAVLVLCVSVVGCGNKTADSATMKKLPAQVPTAKSTNTAPKAASPAVKAQPAPAKKADAAKAGDAKKSKKALPMKAGISNPKLTDGKASVKREDLPIYGYYVADVKKKIAVTFNGKDYPIKPMKRADVDSGFANYPVREGWKAVIPAKDLKRTNKAEVMMDGKPWQAFSVEVKK